MSLVSPTTWSSVAVRLVVAFCTVALLVTTVGSTPRPVAAADVGGQISANRSGQAYAESSMLAQDQAVASLQVQRKAAVRALKTTLRALQQQKAVLASAQAVVLERKRRMARVESLYEPPTEAPLPDNYRERLRVVRGDVAVAERRKRAMGARVRALTRAVNARKTRIRSVDRARRVAIARREAAEASLAARIVDMTRLAAIRAEETATVNLAGGGAFSWPTTGRIVQSYGCTGYELNPRRGSCRHFHDGIDVVDGYGTPIRAVSAGVVAYVGWNPWDESGRAWIVVVVHPDGYVSRYGHLISAKNVRAGEVVHTGRIIGKMGSTGKSTGTHLHFELLRNGRDVNPLSYLPSGVVKIKVDKTTTRQGAAQKARAQRAKAQRAKARKRAQVARARAAQRDQAITRATDTSWATLEICAPQVIGDEGLFDIMSEVSSADVPGCAPGDAAAAASSAASVDPPRAEPADDHQLPGIPLPYRGTSPDPS